MVTLLRKLTILAPLALLASTGFAQVTANLEGDVKGPDGNPLQGAQIKLERTDIKQSFSVKTDKKGHYLYANLPTGTYTITVQVGGKDMDRVTGMRSRQGDNPPVNFDLSKPSASAAAAGGAVPGPPGAAPAKPEAGMTKEERAAYEKKLKEQE